MDPMKNPATSAVAAPKMLWEPLTATVLVLVVGLAALISGQALLVASLGPTAYMMADSPAHPSTRFYNTIVGHLVGLLGGFLVLWILDSWHDPDVLQTGVLTFGRLWSAVLAVFVTVLVTVLIHASHPPAGATTLLVALGSIQQAGPAIKLMVGVLIVASVGEGIRHLRLGRVGRAEST